MGLESSFISSGDGPLRVLPGAGISHGAASSILATPSVSQDILPGGKITWSLLVWVCFVWIGYSFFNLFFFFLEE